MDATAMMGLEIYNSEGKKTFSPDSLALFLSEKPAEDVPTPPYAQKNGVVYRYDTLKAPPRLIGNPEPYGLQTFTREGKLVMDPNRRPLVIKNVVRIKHRFSGGKRPNIEESTPWYFIGPESGNAIVVLNSCYSIQTYIAQGDLSVYVRTSILAPEEKVENGNLYFRVNYYYNEFSWEGGTSNAYVAPYSLDLVVGLTSVPR